MEAEGWFVDPYGFHEARWMSAGKPTALVRDGDTEAQDPPPDTPYVGPLEQLAEAASTNDDLLRADSAESKPFDPKDEEGVAWNTFGQISGAD